MPQQLFIPNLGTLLILAQDWTFRCFFEDRNAGILEACMAEDLADKKRDYSFYWHGPDADDFKSGKIPSYVEYQRAMSEEQLKQSYKSYRATNAEDQPFIRVTLPKGTQLKIDRIYVKRGGESFASITFRTTKVCPDKRFANKRFWAKLQEANQILADVVG